MPPVYNVLSTENPIFSAYLFYAALLTLKLMCMAPLTGRQRFKKKIFAAAEDLAFDSRSKVKFDDPDIERVRRAHLNDLENIPIFLIVALGYILTQPNYTLAVNLFRIFTAGRFMHTLVYAVVVIPQPARAIAWGAGYATTIYMAIRTVMHFA